MNLRLFVARWGPLVGFGTLFVITTLLGSPPTIPAVVGVIVFQALWIGLPWLAGKAGRLISDKLDQRVKSDKSNG